MKDSIVLASASPRRKQLLEWAELSFEVIVKEVDETFPQGVPCADAAMLIAAKKARAVQQDLKRERLVIGADTVVVLDDRIIGKHRDKNAAIETLTALQGRMHQVITGVAMLKGAREQLFADVTEVSFNELSHEQIRFYVDNYRPYDKAGAYAIQEWIGVVGIKRIEGDFYNVMGLPVNRIIKALHQFDVSEI